jgi:hypothetical protein
MEIDKQDFINIAEYISGNPDWKQFAIIVNQISPEIYIDALNILIGDCNPAMIHKYQQLANDGWGKVALIREYRNETGVGLKDAKFWIELNIKGDWND